jgi:hypothetical protein
MRDPNGSNYMCKHVAGVAQGLQDYSFPELIQMFTENIKDSSITRKSSRVSLFTEEFYSVLPEFPCCGIQETFKSISAAMEAKGFREDYRRTFLKSLTDYNYVSQLNKVGLVV